MNFYKWIPMLIGAVRFTGRTSASIRQNEKIKIGVVAPLTGDLAVYGQYMKNSIDLAVENYNAQGGILGEKIETIVYDSKADPIEEVNSFEKLATQDQAAAVIGGVISPTALAIAPLSQKYNLPLITPLATAPEVTKGYKTVFRTNYTTPYEAKGLAEFAYEKLNSRKAAVIYNSSEPYSVALANAFKTAFETKGGKVAAYEGYTNDTEDFNSILTKIKAGNPDLLFIPDYYNTTALILQQAKQLGMDVLFVDGVAWTGWNTVINGNEIFQGGYYSSAYSKEIPTTENKNFIEAYKKKYKEDPNLLAGLTYDAIIILLEAVKKAGSTESNKLIEALEKTDIQGLTGRITFDNEHNPIKPVYMFRIEDGKDILIQKLYPK